MNMPKKAKPKKTVKKKDKPPRLTLAWVRKNIVILKELGGAFQALIGKKPIETKVTILANPKNPLSMSVLSKGQAKFVQLAEFMNGVPEWGGHFEGLKEYSDKMLAVSPSIDGLGREQVIRLIGALGETKLLQHLGLNVKTGQPDKE